MTGSSLHSESIEPRPTTAAAALISAALGQLVPDDAWLTKLRADLVRSRGVFSRELCAALRPAPPRASARAIDRRSRSVLPVS